MMRKSLLRTVITAVAALFVAACEPGDPLVQLRAAIDAELAADTAGVTFQYAFVDLDADGTDDAIALLSGGSVCGSGGCTMLIFRGDGGEFSLVSTSSITSEPIRVLSEPDTEWATLIVYARRVGDVLMRFDGNGYPMNPSMQPEADDDQLAAAQLLELLDP